MVKIRLKRVGAKGRPHYRLVVAPSTAARGGRFVETLGTYDPVAIPKKYEVNEERAMHWLMHGAQPTETAAVVLSRTGIMEKYLQQRPEKRKDFAFLDKRTAAMSKQSAVTMAAAAEPPVPVAEAPVRTTEDTVQTAAENVETAETSVEAPSEAQPEASDEAQ